LANDALHSAGHVTGRYRSNMLRETSSSDLKTISTQHML